MIREEALALANKITRIWPRGAISLDTWTEVLGEMFYGPAEATIRKLRDTSEHAPAIAAFKGAYNGELGTARVDRIECSKCGGDGWVSVKQYEVNGVTYDGVKPCTCRNGNETRDVHRRIVEHNDNELARFGRGHDEHAVGPPRFNPKEVA